MSRWKKLEENVAKMLDGEVAKASGAVSFQKCDVESEDYVVECKYTSKEKLVLEKEDLESIWSYSVYRDKTPLLALAFLENFNDFQVIELVSRVGKSPTKTKTVRSYDLAQFDQLLGFEVKEIDKQDFGWWSI